jgi:hypothetical protein
MQTMLTIAAIAFFCSTAAAAQQEVTCESPCKCSSAHGKGRWAVKNDPSTPPTDATAIQSVTPSDIFSWPGPAEHLTQSSARTGIENNWFALTGRVVAVKVEADGDLHIELSDATDRRPDNRTNEAPVVIRPGLHAPKRSLPSCSVLIQFGYGDRNRLQLQFSFSAKINRL